MLYISFESFYENNQILKSKFGYSIQEIESLFPYEREYYMLITKNELEKEEKENV